MVVMKYRTRDGLADYGFLIDFGPGRHFQQGDGDSLSLPCQSIDGNGRRYVDWSGKLGSPRNARLDLDNVTSA